MLYVVLVSCNPCLGISNALEVIVSISKRDLVAVQGMYNALMAIGCIDPVWLVPQTKPIERAQEIANACMKEMNVEHTQLIQKALGIGE
jgi:hypothetical protein